MSASEPRRRLFVALAVLICSAVASASGQKALRIAEDAAEIRAFRLKPQHLTQLRQVSDTLARSTKPTPERPRTDGAMFAVLSMSLAYGEPFSDPLVARTVRTIEAGHADLAAAIRRAGLSTSDYVLTQISLLLSYPVVAAERAGRGRKPVSDTAPENIAFVRSNWTEVDAIMKELGAASGPREP